MGHLVHLYEDINEEIIRANLDATPVPLRDTNGTRPIEVFQIDDGWQALGWIEPTRNFRQAWPIWLQTFGLRASRPDCGWPPSMSPEAQIYSEQEDWWVTDETGAPILF